MATDSVAVIATTPSQTCIDGIVCNNIGELCAITYLSNHVDYDKYLSKERLYCDSGYCSKMPRPFSK
jgi:hypothetical protein